jgi:mRNA-degrading endonuclease RelE of RelBE toxin-antitoxin system
LFDAYVLNKLVFTKKVLKIGTAAKQSELICQGKLKKGKYRIIYEVLWIPSGEAPSSTVR